MKLSNKFLNLLSNQERAEIIEEGYDMRNDCDSCGYTDEVRLISKEHALCKSCEEYYGILPS